ncbi:MAG: DMT family transporter [Bacteroidales bacterium]|nr:DMT family transporter [Bacteroidales bacterium]
MWVILGLFSALFLGIYDAVRKKALKGNPVIPVLFIASLTGAILFVPFIVGSSAGIIASDSAFFVPEISLLLHLKIFLKSFIVGFSWFLAYHALSHLPLTIMVPIRSTGPMWTLLGAIIIYGERFTTLQWSGIIIVLCFFYYFTLAGRREGIDFFRNKWIFAAIGATLVGAVSSLYDKYLFSQYDRMAVQSWYTLYLIVVLLPFLMLLWYPRRKAMDPFRWSPLIPLIGILLVLSDFLYFYALGNPDSLIAVLSVIRRSSVIISFVSGALFFRETNLKRKGLALLGILAGVILIVTGSL